MKSPISLSLATFFLVAQVFAHVDLQPRSPGMPDNNNPETPKKDLGEREPGLVPELMTPFTPPEGLGSTFCPQGMGFCGSRDACCGMGGVCCPSGGCCNEPGTGCFPDKDGRTLCCKAATEKLCTSKTCIPKNSVCCKDGSYCEAGSYCTKAGCCKAGMICKQKTGAKSSGFDTRAIEPQKIKAPPL